MPTLADLVQELSAGGPGSGRHPEGGSKPKSQSALLNKYGKKIVSEKALRAKQNFAHIAKAEQDKAEGMEALIAKHIGGQVAGKDSEPVDVTFRDKQGKLHGIEVKTMLNQKNDKITMKREAMDRKAQWSADNGGAQVHTVVADLRDGGMQLYHRNGYGSFRVGNLDPVEGNFRTLRATLGAK